MHLFRPATENPFIPTKNAARTSTETQHSFFIYFLRIQVWRSVAASSSSVVVLCVCVCVCTRIGKKRVGSGMGGICPSMVNGLAVMEKSLPRLKLARGVGAMVSIRAYRLGSRPWEVWFLCERGAKACFGRFFDHTTNKTNAPSKTLQSNPPPPPLFFWVRVFLPRARGCTRGLFPIGPCCRGSIRCRGRHGQIHWHEDSLS